ncbi:hypothetical protein MMC21_001287 [Puttea exsequens]|nr:hypothetical protein [Puttea exsequens]
MDDLQVRLKYKKSDADDWTKVEDKVIRKKLQNRLAKRKSRTNNNNGTKSKARRRDVSFDRLPESPETPISEEQVEGLLTQDIIQDQSLTFPSFSINDRSEVSALDGKNQSLSAELCNGLDMADPLVAKVFATPGLSEHRFIHMTQYSLTRALVLNATILGLDRELLADDDAISPWTVAEPFPAKLENDLAPTAIQLSTPHHPYLDILTPRKLRDNIMLTLLDTSLEDSLCYDMHVGAFTVWGSQPWNSFGWEASQWFATTWGWLLDEDLIRTSNFWRGERGEPPLEIPDRSLSKGQYFNCWGWISSASRIARLSLHKARADTRETQ